MTKVLILADASSALLRCWANLQDDEHPVYLVSVKDKDSSLPDIYHKQISVENSVLRSYVKLLFNIRKLVKEIKPDIIISHFTISYGVIANHSRFHPHISVVYGSDVFIDKLRLRIINRRILKKADKIIVSAENTKRYLKSAFNVDESKVITKSWGINNEIFNLAVRENKKFKTTIFDELNIDSNGKYILSPRLIGPVYNHEIILKAFEKISKTHPDYKLIMMHYNLKSTDHYYNLLLKVSQELGITDKIIWTKRYLTSREMADIFSVSEVLINIPKYDQLASTILEGISCGCFSIVSDLNPYYDVVEEGINGFILKENTPESIFEAFSKYSENKSEFDKNALKSAKDIHEKYREEYFIKHIRAEIDSLVSKFKE